MLFCEFEVERSRASCTCLAFYWKLRFIEKHCTYIHSTMLCVHTAALYSFNWYSSSISAMSPDYEDSFLNSNNESCSSGAFFMFF